MNIRYILCLITALVISAPASLQASPQKWWGENREEILIPRHPFPTPEMDYNTEKERNIKLKEDEAYRQRIKKELWDLCLLFGCRTDYDYMILEMGLSRLKGYTGMERKLLVDAFNESDEIEDANRRVGALIAFRYSPVSGVREILKDRIANSRHVEEIGYAAQSLLEIGDEEAVSLIKPRLKDASLDEGLRAWLMLCLAGHLDDELTALFKETVLLRNKPMTHRRACLVALTMSEVPGTAETLRVFAFESPDHEIRYEAIRLLAFLKGDERDAAIKQLMELLEDDIPEARREAAYALNQMDPKRIKSKLFSLLKKEKDLRALEGLALACSLRTSSGSDFITLKKLLIKNADPDLSFSASLGLGLAGYEKSVSFMLDNFDENRHDWSRKGALYGLGLLKHKKGIEKIIEMLHDRRFATLQPAAAEALGMVCSEEVKPELEKALEEPDVKIRRIIVQSHALFETRYPEALPRLKALLKEDSGKAKGVKFAAAFAIDMIQGDVSKDCYVLNFWSGENKNSYPKKRIDGKAILDLVNSYYPVYHKVYFSWGAGKGGRGSR